MASLKLDSAQLRAMAQRLRRHSLVSTTEAGSGHPTSCLSCAEIVSALFFSEMTFDPGDPFSPGMDAFVMSKGHAVPILWAALYEAGAIDDDLKTLRRFESRLEGHPTPRNPWVRVATGSLGQGLSAACGMALARRLDRKGSRVYVLQGDGETAEGAVWEAAAFAAHHKIDNLCLVVDVNRLGQSGPTMLQHDVETYRARFAAFGWNALVVDGHDVGALLKAFAAARETRGRPTAIVARTEKGKGVSFLEGKDGWHGKPVPKDQLEAALKEVGAGDVGGKRPAPERRESAFVDPAWTPWTPAYKVGDSVATREAYGRALVELGKVHPGVCAVDGDVKNSTFSEKFKEAFPDRFFEAYIAEQNMVGVAMGLAAEGKVPFASSFACFLARAYDFLRMAGYSRPRHLVLCGSHVGVSIGEDGPSQMGLEDIAMMRAVYGCSVLYPCDAVSSERCVQTAARTPGIVYLRTSRPKTKVIYDAKEEFPLGGSKTLRSSPKDAAAVIAAGVTLHEALKAADLLAKEGVAVRVIDAYSVKPLDEEAMRRAARETKRLVVVEDHAPAGGLGEAVAAAVAGISPVTHLAVREIPRSGKPEELVEKFGIGASSIVAAVKAAR